MKPEYVEQNYWMRRTIEYVTSSIKPNILYFPIRCQCSLVEMIIYVIYIMRNVIILFHETLQLLKFSSRDSIHEISLDVSQIAAVLS